MQADKELLVFICGELCGTLRQDGNGAFSFKYRNGYEGVPLSMSMPVGYTVYGHRVVRPFLQGLLPDNEGTRANLGRQFGVSGENPFALLSHIGMDCPGGVQLCDEEGKGVIEAASGELRRLDEDEIGNRLREVRGDGAAAWMGNGSRPGQWSLGGCQEKLALCCREGVWYECFGAQPTTHILKPGVTGFDHQAFDEYLCMKLAKRIELPVSEVEYRFFGDEPAIVIERYDRSVVASGAVERVHQEDLCQALGVSPSRKYAEQGGPSTPDVVQLLERTGANARGNTYQFVLSLFFNYLIGATDAHAKNHSLVFKQPNDVVLAPLYDVASIAPYRSLSPTQRKPLRAAMSIGGENVFGNVRAAHARRMVATCGLEKLGLGEDVLLGAFRTMASIVPDALSDVIADAKRDCTGFEESMPQKMLSGIAAHCTRTLDSL